MEEDMKSMLVFKIFLTLLLCSKQALSLDCQQYAKTLQEWNANSLKYVEDPSQVDFSVWHKQKGELQGVALSVHGLNNNIKNMEELNNTLATSGVTTLSVLMLGHRGDSQEAKAVEFNEIQEQLESHYCFVKRRAQDAQVPLYIMAYSMGAALMTDFLQRHPEEKPFVRRLFLFAPAFRLTEFAKMSRLALMLPRSWVMRSNMHKDFRANDYTPLNLYGLVWQVFSAVNEPSRSLPFDVETFVFMDQTDILIDYESFRAMTSQQPLWSLYEIVTKGGVIEPNFGHFIIHPGGMRKTEWAKLTQFIKSQIELESFNQ
jgi:hypothetical protein